MIYGSIKECQQGELLAESQAIQKKDWMKYRFIIQPKKRLNYIMLMAYYATEKNTNGNILVDNFSNITPCPCSKLKNQNQN